MRRLAVLLVALVLAVAAAGCRLDVGVEVDVAADGSGTIRVTAVADADVVARAPRLGEDLDFADAVAAGWQVEGPAKGSDGSLKVVVSHEFATVEEATALLGSINGPDGPLHDVVLNRATNGDEIAFTLAGTVRIDGGLNAFADPDLLKLLGASPFAQQIADAQLTPAEAVGVSFSVHLPGSVQSTAKVDGSTVSWKVPVDGQSADLASSSRLSRSNPGGGAWRLLGTAALVLAVVWAVVATALILAVRRARQRRATRRQPTRTTSATRQTASRRRGSARQTGTTRGPGTTRGGRAGGR